MRCGADMLDIKVLVKSLFYMDLAKYMGVVVGRCGHTAKKGLLLYQ
ncbi:MAG: hypothetical protein ACJAZJ_001532 [Candidatus Endobugula sp.]|jgi:hypothetical protein